MTAGKTGTAQTADGTAIAFSISGSGEPLLLIGGQGADRRMWNSLRPLLEPRYRVITYDHRGTGLSDKPIAPAYSTQLFAEDAAAVMSAAGVEKAHVLGFSMGGRIAQWLAIRHPDRVAALILCATSPGNRRGVPRAESVSRILAGHDLKAIDALLYSQEHLISGGRIYRPAAIPNYARRMHFTASEAHDAWDELPSISAPTLVLHGSEDQINPPANGDILAQRIPGAELVVLQGARHGWIDERPEACSRIIIRHLESHGVSRARTVPSPGS